MKKTLQNTLFSWTQKLEKRLFVETIRGALVSLIPVLLLGSFALIASSFPVQGYQTAIRSFGNGIIYNTLQMVYKATYGVLSVYMTFCITVSYRRAKRKEWHRSRTWNIRTAEMTSLVCFFILSGVSGKEFSLTSLGTTRMLTAIIAGYFSAVLYFWFFDLLKPEKRRLYSDGADPHFNSAMASILPAVLTILIFAGLNVFVCSLFDVPTFHTLTTNLLTSLFSSLDKGFLGGLVFVLASSLLWFFGIHGSDCLEGVINVLYTPMIDVNAAAVAAGNPPTEILTKQTFDVFVLMGGCGTAMCLLLALLIFGKRKSDQSLARASFFPMLFNTNETIMFGLPVIFNPVLFIPFICMPLVSYTLTYFALYTGFVPLLTTAVEWTTPVFMSGYVATGSIRGAILQGLILVVGTLIYAPFIRLLDRVKMNRVKEQYNDLVKEYKKYEANGNAVILTEMESATGDIAKMLAVDLREAISDGSIALYYQPQVSYSGHWTGAEALMRWEHSLFGMIYPPLVIQIADESGCLEQLEKQMIRKAAQERHIVCQALGEDVVVSVNVTGPTVSQAGFADFMQETMDETDAGGFLCLEITEQTAMISGETLEGNLRRMKDMGIQLAIDDFSMGQTSIRYLEGKHFDHIKLDGSMTKNLIGNPRVNEIVSSLARLSAALGIGILAEYVETNEQREALAALGCKEYQGYLYSPAVPLEKLKNLTMPVFHKISPPAAGSEKNT